MHSCIRGCLVALILAYDLTLHVSSAVGASVGQSDRGANAAIAMAKTLRLADDSRWQKLLFVREHVLGSRRSLISSPRFFLAAGGNENPELELTADLAGFYLDQSTLSQGDLHPQCLYPARLQWLREALPGGLRNLPNVTCPALHEWRSKVTVHHAAIVFSSYYANNPASMFGHSFLVLRRKAGPNYNALLDEAVSYVAFPDTENPVLYSLRGMTGRFPGRLLMQPYYMKVQEYNNADSRDLWEYDLALTGVQLQRLMNILWELGPNEIPYYYFDQNCSAVMQLILAAALPEYDLGFSHPWVIPSDTLRSLTRQGGLVGDVLYRPSSLSVFLQRYRALNSFEQGRVDQILADNDVREARAALQLFDAPARAEIIDTVLDGIDFKERIAGASEPIEFADLRRTLLKERSAMPKLSASPTGRDALASNQHSLVERPDSSPPSARLSAGGGYSSEHGAYGDVEWRPALHDLASSDFGFPSGLAIEFFGLTARAYHDQRFLLEKFILFAVRSVPSIEAIVRPWAWGLEIGGAALEDCTKSDFSCHQSFVRGGRGVSGRIGNVAAYALFGAQTGYTTEPQPRWFLGPYLTTGVVVQVAQTMKFTIEGVRSREFELTKELTERDALTGTLAWSISGDSELKLTARWRKHGAEGTLAFGRYY